MRKILLKLHFWLSVPFGIIISILCLTGALLVFENEIKELISPSLYKASMKQENPLPIEELIPLVKKQLPDSLSISSVTIPSNPQNNYRLGLVGQRRTSLLVDPYTGEVKGMVNPYSKDDFFSFVRRLHRWFLLEHKQDSLSWGRMITGTATLMFVFILVSGIIIWTPKTIKSLKKKLKIHIRKGGFRFWYDTHLAGGMYVILFLLTMSLTGLTWSFDWYKNGFYKVFGVEQTTPQHTQTVNKPDSSEKGKNKAQNKIRPAKKDDVNYEVWTKVLRRQEESNPDYKTISIQNGTVAVAKNRTGNTRAADNYSFDSYTGEITDVKYYNDQPKSAKIRGWIYSVHVGTWGGIMTKILYFIACLIGTTLPWSGYYIYLKKRRNSKRKVSD